MTKACLIPTPAERDYGAILTAIEEDVTRKIYAALEEAADRCRSEVAAAGVDMQPPVYEYFVSVVHQRLYCTLCGANPMTFEGGRVDAAIAVIRNSRNIAERYWGAIPEPSV